jgi:hypothetical protein
VATKKRAAKSPVKAKRKKTAAKRKQPAVQWISEADAEQLGIDEGSKIVKQLAAQQKIDEKIKWKRSGLSLNAGTTSGLRKFHSS